MKQEYPKLPKKFKQKWVKALRSGKYHQTKGLLLKLKADKTPKSYCCLGVACDILGYTTEQIYNNFTLTDVVQETELRNLFKCDVKINSWESLQMFFEKMNDKWRWDFKRIADWIERNL